MFRFPRLFATIAAAITVLLLDEGAMAEKSAPDPIPSVGYFPRSFPRDPVNVNIYLEHILLGQIIEPLVESAPDGKIVPAVAESWKILQGGKEVEFTIRKGLKFSNGKLVTAEDVKFSLERHISSGTSQSKPFLQRISSFEVISENKILLRLERPYVALFKALSRDQLGILPKGWKFDETSSEPFIGTGAYRAIRSENGWQLQKNSHFRDAPTVQIEKWNVLMNPKDNAWAGYQTADFVPFVTLDLMDDLRKTRDANSLLQHPEPVIHFFQSTIWCYPHGKTCRDDARKRLGASALAELVQRCIARKKLNASTGSIPQGIPGFLPETPKTEQKLDVDVKDREFTLAAVSRDLEVFDSPEDLALVEKKFDVKIRLKKIDPTILSTLPKDPPDYLTVSHAGGFYDPEGFLIVLSPAMMADLASIFGPNYPAYVEASEIVDWNKRNDAYKNLNKRLTESLLVIPGWKHEASRFRKPFLRRDEGSLRYTPKLKDYRIDAKLR